MDAGVPPAVAPASPAPESSVAQAAFSWLRDLALSVAIMIIVILFLYQPVKVEGTSMMPSLINQERIFINKFIYRFRDSSAAIPWSFSSRRTPANPILNA